METAKEIPKPKKRSGKKIALLLLAALALVLIITEATGHTQTLQTLLNPSMHFTDIASIPHEVGSNPQIHATATGLFLATRDSVRFHNADGTEIFRASHNMQNPMLFGRGDFAAIAEDGGRSINVYSAAGLMYHIATEHPLTSFSLSPTGFSAIITYRGGAYGMYVYGPTGARRREGIHTDANVVPMLGDISHDGSMWAISYLDINDAQMNSFVNFISVDRMGHLVYDYLDDIFAASLDNPDQIIAAMRFMDNGTLVAISDTLIFAIDPTTGATIWESPVNNRISRVFFGDNWLAVAYGEPILNRSGLPTGAVVAYSTAGARLFSHQIDSTATSLVGRGNNIVVGAGGHFTAISRNGQVLWEHTMPNNFTNMSILGSIDQAVASSPTETRVLRRIRQ
ncbi:MAG: DUF5711 family protein [Defluviitaleaceae bacterium]|nr:DUF5711 family protein [Defluviitaleaceae bacterium]